MLDSWNMKPLRFARSCENSMANYICVPGPFMALRLIRRLGCIILVLLCSVFSYAQQDLQSGAQQSSACSAPLNAGAPQCQGVTQQAPMTGLQAPSPNSTVTQPRTPGNYVDNENFSRQGSQRYQGDLYGRSQFAQRQFAPEPLTEFQKFIASTTGEILPIYGASLFDKVPSTFAPSDMTPVPSNFVIGPDDELRVRVWGQVSFQANLRVDRSGEIYLPHIGSVHVAGLQFSALDTQLRTAVGRVYRNFDLTVDMGQIRSIQVYVTGQARRPGVYTVSSLSTLVDALFASGGPSVHGSLRHIELRRGDTVVSDFDLYDLITRGDKSKDVKLLPEDVIYIPPAGPQVAVTGSVRVRAIYELRGPETLSALFSDTGGISSVASSARVSIERIEDHRDRHVMEVAFDKAGLSTLLSDGDVINITSIIPSYRKTVTLRGNIANPGRFAWHPGMHVSELIPDKESLITRDYWWRRAKQGLPAPEFEPTTNWENLRQPTHATKVPPYRVSGNMYGSQQGQMSLGQEAGALGQTVAQQGATGDQQYPYDAEQGGVSPGMQPEAQSQPSGLGNSALGGEQYQQYSGYRSMGRRTKVSILAPEIDWNFASIERLDPNTLKTTVLPFDLGKLVLHHDASQDLELQPGDVVSIFSEADIQVPLAQQTKLVKLEGEFVHAGFYSVKSGETLRALVERAGGFSPAAYLYGSQFSRKSTRVIQQMRINEYVQSVQMQMERGNMALVAAGTNPQDQTSQKAAQSSEQELMSRLHQIRATGRIVLEFQPGSQGIESVPNIPLEDGDVFVVPSVPSSVNVVGAVNNQNSFLYNRVRKVGYYLQMAGGPNRSADSKHAFVIRANGEVVARERWNGPWGNSFESLRMNPGDTIVVPDKTIKPSAMRGFLDWSQLFSQFALGAAYLTVLP